jgi:putative cofactor-binding repeat protein
MKIARRHMMLGSLSFGLATLALPVMPRAREALADGGAIDQTAALQAAIDRAARSGMPLNLPAGIYETGRLTLKSGVRIRGVPRRTILCSRGGEAIFKLEAAETVGLSGLVLDGNQQTLGMDGALLVADDVSGLAIDKCRFIGSGADGVALQCVSGRIAGSRISRIGGTGLLVVECGDLAIVGNTIEQAATGLSLSGAPDDSSIVVRGNVIRELHLRKTLLDSGVGIVADSGAVIRGNIIEGAPSYGILRSEGTRETSVAGNTIRNAYIDIAVSAPLSRPLAVA